MAFSFEIGELTSSVVRTIITLRNSRRLGSSCPATSPSLDELVNSTPVCHRGFQSNSGHLARIPQAFRALFQSCLWMHSWRRSTRRRIWYFRSELGALDPRESNKNSFSVNLRGLDMQIIGDLESREKVKLRLEKWTLRPYAPTPPAWHPLYHSYYSYLNFGPKMRSSSTHSTRSTSPLLVEPQHGKIPVTPTVLRSIFASSRTPLEERSISRVAFFRRVLRYLLSFYTKYIKMTRLF